ncbi:MAG: hypothetical protein WCJ54_07380, partial [Actinomycetota bacterium]
MIRSVKGWFGISSLIPLIAIKNNFTLSEVAILFAIMRSPYLLDFFTAELAKKYKGTVLKYLPPTTTLEKFDKVPKGKVYIVRPAGRKYYSGHGIYIISDDEELAHVKKIYN